MVRASFGSKLTGLKNGRFVAVRCTQSSPLLIVIPHATTGSVTKSSGCVVGSEGASKCIRKVTSGLVKSISRPAATRSPPISPATSLPDQPSILLPLRVGLTATVPCIFKERKAEAIDSIQLLSETTPPGLNTSVNRLEREINRCAWVSVHSSACG